MEQKQLEGISLQPTQGTQKTKVVDGIDFETWAGIGESVLFLRKKRPSPGAVLTSYQVSQPEDAEFIGLVASEIEDNRAVKLARSLAKEGMLPRVVATMECHGVFNATNVATPGRYTLIVFEAQDGPLSVWAKQHEQQHDELERCGAAISDYLWRLAQDHRLSCDGTKLMQWVYSTDGARVMPLMVDVRVLLPIRQDVNAGYLYSAGSFVESVKQDGENVEALLAGFDRDFQAHNPYASGTSETESALVVRSVVSGALETGACAEAYGFELLDNERPSHPDLLASTEEVWKACEKRTKDCRYAAHLVNHSGNADKLNELSMDVYHTTSLALQGIAVPIKNAFPCAGGSVVLYRTLDGHLSDILADEILTNAEETKRMLQQVVSLVWGLMNDNGMDLEQQLVADHIAYTKSPSNGMHFFRLDTRRNRPVLAPRLAGQGAHEPFICQFSDLVMDIKNNHQTPEDFDDLVMETAQSVYRPEDGAIQQWDEERFDGDLPFLPVASSADENKGPSDNNDALGSDTMWDTFARSSGYILINPLPRTSIGVQARYTIRRLSDNRESEVSFYAFNNDNLDIQARALRDAFQLTGVVRPKLDEFWCLDPNSKEEEPLYYRMVVEPRVEGTLDRLISTNGGSGSLKESEAGELIKQAWGIINRIVINPPRAVNERSDVRLKFDLLDARPSQFVYARGRQDGRFHVWLADTEAVDVRRLLRDETSSEDRKEQRVGRAAALMWNQFIARSVHLRASGVPDIMAALEKVLKDDKVAKTLLETTEGYAEASKAIAWTDHDAIATRDPVKISDSADQCLVQVLDDFIGNLDDDDDDDEGGESDGSKFAPVQKSRRRTGTPFENCQLANGFVPLGCATAPPAGDRDAAMTVAVKKRGSEEQPDQALIYAGMSQEDYQLCVADMLDMERTLKSQHVGQLLPYVSTVFHCKNKQQAAIVIQEPVTGMQRLSAVISDIPADKLAKIVLDALTAIYSSESDIELRWRACVDTFSANPKGPALQLSTSRTISSLPLYAASNQLGNEWQLTRIIRALRDFVLDFRRVVGEESDLPKELEDAARVLLLQRYGEDLLSLPETPL